MALEVANKTIHTSYKEVAGSNQQKVSTRLYAEKSHSISKILCMNMLVCNSDAEILNEEARYQTKVRFEVVYLSEDGECYSLTDIVNATGRIQNPMLKVNMYPLVTSSIIDKQITSMQADMVELMCIVDTQINVIATDEVTFVENANNDVVNKKEKFSYYTMVNGQKNKFRVSEEVEIKEHIGKLLSANAQLCNERIIPGTNYVTIRGEIYLTLFYELEEENKQAKCTCKLFSFEEEVELNHTTPNSVIMFTSNVLTDEINIVGNRVNDMTLLKSSIGLNYNLVALEKQEADALVDVFSLLNEVNLTVGSFHKTAWTDMMVANETIDSVITLEYEQGEIISVEAQCEDGVFVANAYAQNGAVQIEGVVQANVVYYIDGKEENHMQYESALLEVPYSVTLTNSEVTENTLVSVQVAIKSLNAVRKSAREFDVEVELCMFVELNENAQQMVVENIEIIPSNSEEEVALRMFMVGRNNDLWDVCKKTRTTPETLLSQNPETTFPLKEDTVLIIYKQKQ